MRTLHEISSDLHALADLMTDLDGEIPDGEIGQEIEAFFETVMDERDSKIRNYCALIEMLDFQAENGFEIAKRVEMQANKNKAAVWRLKARLKEFFQAHDIPKLELGIFTPRIQKNGGLVPLIVPDSWERDPASAPEQFHKIKVELDTQAVRDAIRNDEETYGAQLGERGSHLRLR